MDATKYDFRASEEMLMPIDRSLLSMQDSHVTKLIWSGHVRECIRPNDHSLTVTGWQLSRNQVALIKKTGFYGLSSTGYVHLDSHLITAVLDRWRPETNTFHFPFGEMTVTLEDVAFILGLPVSGKVVCGGSPSNSREFVQKMLGEAPKVGTDDLCGNRIKLTWLRRTFANNRILRSGPQTVRATRAYILYLLGSTVFSDSGTGYVAVMYLALLDKLEEASSYAWGAAALAYLYRTMTKAVTVIDGCVPINLCGSFTLLMCWIYEHIPIGRPVFQPDRRYLFPVARKWNKAHVGDGGRRHYICFRSLFDKLQWEDVCFQPYLHFPNKCKLARDATQYGCVDLVITVFHVNATYNASRCMAQYGKVQHVPGSPIQVKLSFTSRHSTKRNYQRLYSKHISVWDAYCKDPNKLFKRSQDAVGGRLAEADYSGWYEAKTIRRVEPYTYEEVRWLREIRELKEIKQAATEYAALSQPYVGDVLTDKHNRLSELFHRITQGTLLRTNSRDQTSFPECNEDTSNSENSHARRNEVSRSGPDSEVMYVNGKESFLPNSEARNGSDGCEVERRTDGAGQQDKTNTEFEMSSERNTSGIRAPSLEKKPKLPRLGDKQEDRWTRSFQIRSLVGRYKGNLFSSTATISNSKQVEVSEVCGAERAYSEYANQCREAQHSRQTHPAKPNLSTRICTRQASRSRMVAVSNGSQPTSPGLTAIPDNGIPIEYRNRKRRCNGH